MKKRLGILGLILASMMAMEASAGGFAPGLYEEPTDPFEGESDEDRKRRFHRMNPTDTSEREFVIKGERIMAHDKKTAMKIYANRHPESKKRKK